jgi:hypothetical protein
MRRHHETQGIRDESEIRMPYPVSNPTDQQYRDAGWLPVVEADPVPAGMVSTDGVAGAVEGDAYVERHVRIVSQAEYYAQQAATIAAEQTRQAKLDCADYSDALTAIAGLAQVVPSIAAGDGMPEIVSKAAQAHEAALQAGDVALASRITARSLAADSAWDEMLCPAGVTGARLWRAFGVLAKGG